MIFLISGSGAIMPVVEVGTYVESILLKSRKFLVGYYEVLDDFPDAHENEILDGLQALNDMLEYGRGSKCCH